MGADNPADESRFPDWVSCSESGLPVSLARVLIDYRTVLGPQYRPVVANVGPQAGAIAHLVRLGAEASLCGIPVSALGDYEDLDEPICPRCIAWHLKLGE